MRVAFLGMGKMGRLMAARVLAGGHELTLWNRTPGRAGELVAAGAREAASVADAVADADVAVLMLYGPESAGDVMESVHVAAPAGLLVINATTVGPEAARELGRAASAAGLRYVDAPVVGTLGPAREGKLKILVGASELDLAAARPTLELFGDPERIVRVGDVGAGSALKLVVNLSLAAATAAIAETLALGTDLGLDRQVVLDELAGGFLGGILGYKRPMIESGDFTPPAFTVEALAKDVRLAIRATPRPLGIAQAVLDLTGQAADRGHGEADFSAIADLPPLDAAASPTTGTADPARRPYSTQA
ncbi:NAD(P)-dependent oxidoreductase [Frankia sp. CNm7]|uniref:NAD(P)-dependent oxidoreductase n=1 Tax=Frankia nepalensis TaxID=1836974 RepID=A0A937R7S2_9ACTN|nr:NAD(P)-dependent oxidoreductase [Frankia nepalensis]MBL7496830.1 NAD(P)-dependent oxidoreductase [Frankia nepalensis]MBL7510959.1 NAD(P)-dependent oxidoreductase [Frankia nepalensis]MBL7523483.1 NAD(P)-dependent oxidoreductase [Frankia nepalensis]MBL7626916.1 NAD(P)-dependent oxidoreductase [Frankia nepalensis]